MRLSAIHLVGPILDDTGRRLCALRTVRRIILQVVQQCFEKWTLGNS